MLRHAGEMGDLNEGALFEAEGLGADGAGGPGPGEDADDEGHVEDTDAANQRSDQDQEKERGDREEDVDQHAEDRVDLAAEVASGQADDSANDGADRGGDEADLEGVGDGFGPLHGDALAEGGRAENPVRGRLLASGDGAGAAVGVGDAEAADDGRQGNREEDGRSPDELSVAEEDAGEAAFPCARGWSAVFDGDCRGSHGQDLAARIRGSMSGLTRSRRRLAAATETTRRRTLPWTTGKSDWRIEL